MAASLIELKVVIYLSDKVYCSTFLLPQNLSVLIEFLVNGSFIFLQIYPPPDFRLCVQQAEIESTFIPVIFEASIIVENTFSFIPLALYCIIGIE